MASNGKWTHPSITRIRDVAARQGFDSVTSFLGGWIDYSGSADITFDSGTYTKGSAVVHAEYLLRGDICFYKGKWVRASNTSFPTALMQLKLPFAYDGTYFPSFFGGRVVDVSAGSGTPVSFEAVGTGRQTKTYIGTTKASQEFVSNTVPFTWATSDYLTWNFWYRIQT